MTVRGKGLRDFILWNLFVVIVFIHYWTKTQGTSEQASVEFFVIIWLVSFVIAVAMKTWEPRNVVREAVDFDENIQRTSFNYVVIGLVAIEVLMVVFGFIAEIMGAFTAIYVPQPRLLLTTLTKYDDILFNITLVATSEETMKVVSIKALYAKLHMYPYGREISILVPIVFWGILHGYQSYLYMGAAMWFMIVAAIAAGLVFYWLLDKTKSIIPPIMAHGIHNSLIILLS